MSYFFGIVVFILDLFGNGKVMGLFFFGFNQLELIFVLEFKFEFDFGDVFVFFGWEKCFDFKVFCFDDCFVNSL